MNNFVPSSCTETAEKHQNRASITPHPSVQQPIIWLSSAFTAGVFEPHLAQYLLFSDANRLFHLEFGCLLHKFLCGHLPPLLGLLVETQEFDVKDKSGSCFDLVSLWN